MSKDYYKTLDVEKTASQDEIKKADFIDSLDNFTIRDLTQLIKYP